MRRTSVRQSMPTTATATLGTAPTAERRPANKSLVQAKLSRSIVLPNHQLTSRPTLWGIDSPPRRQILACGAWWGLVTGLGEGAIYLFHGSAVWPDFMRAGLWVNLLLFLFLALLGAIAVRTTKLERQLIVRLNLGFAFLFFYDIMSNLESATRFRELPFLSTLLAAALVAWFCFRNYQAVVAFQLRTLPFLAAFAVGCGLLLPVWRGWRERQQAAQLASAAPGTKNVLLIVVDTLGASHLSAYGYPRPTSPNLQSIAEQGVLFENAISTSSWTL